jgi:UDP-N-acetylmuramoyl-L-alanyl-D-glutamate--2,6-diaminopimelate ligase
MAETVNLAALIARLPAGTTVRGDAASRAIAAVESDSRRVVPGALFVALRGEHADGHAFVAQAIAAGAAAVVVEAPPALLPSRTVLVAVADTRRALSSLAAAFYGDPSHALDVVGVTGTNGKTTTVHMLRGILEQAGVPTGTIGTVGASFGTLDQTLAHTTPLPPELHALLAEMRADGARAVAMEVSSHALALGRVDDVRFRAGVLTNVTRDHLDFHQTVEAYAAAKRRLFDLCAEAVLNADDAWGARWARDLAAAGTRVTTYGEREGATLVATAVETSPDAVAFSLDGTRFVARFPGRFNVANALAAIGGARVLGVGDAASARGLLQLERVPGRMQRLREDGVDAIVDYAHTPDALHHTLSALRETTTGSLAVVFGCGGNRDRGKRREMGATAARLADRLYVTNDNPRTEDPRAIAGEIVAGIGARPHVVELDRGRAIERAIVEAQPGDVVLIAGKGHEAYQIVGNDVLEFDDAEAARRALRMRGGSP